MRNFIFMAYFLFGNTWLSMSYAQSYTSVANARSQAMGQIYSVIPGLTNPAFFSFEPGWRFEMNYTDRYHLKELSTLSASLQYPSPYLDGAIHFSRYGIEEWNETRISTHFSRLLTENWGIGMRINYDCIHFSEVHPDRKILTADIGMLIQLKEQPVKIGFILCNPLQTKTEIGESKLTIDLPVVFLVGATYTCSTIPLLLATEIGKQEDQSLQWKGGIEYLPFSILSVRAGLQSVPFVPGFGFGLRLSSLEINAGFSSFSELGITSSLGLSYSF